MKKNKLSAITVIICGLACAFMLGIIVKDYLIPIINGTISELPEGQIYTVEDVPLAVAEYVDFEMERYAYTQLSSNEQEVYNRLLMGMCSFADRVDIKSCGITLEGLRKVYSCMRNDYPEMFWIYNNCEVYNTGKIITDCMPSYIYEEKEAITMIGQLEQILTQLMLRVDGMSDYEKVMFVFNYIIDTTQYDLDSYDDYQNGTLTEGLELSSSIYGTLVGRKAMCEGYSKTVQYLLNKMGIECLYITGESEGEGHAWNYVKLDNVYYGLDVTWCDPKSMDDMKSYAYCLVDYDTLKVNHEEDVPYRLPECKGGRYNYYKYNGYELNTFSLTELETMFYKAYVNGNAYAGMDSFVEIHCTSQNVYDSFVQSIEDQTIFQCFDSIERTFNKHYDTLNYGLIDDVWIVRIGL